MSCKGSCEEVIKVDEMLSKREREGYDMSLPVPHHVHLCAAAGFEVCLDVHDLTVC